MYLSVVAAVSDWLHFLLFLLQAELQKEAQKSLDEFIVQFKNDEAAGTEERIKVCFIADVADLLL